MSPRTTTRLHGLRALLLNDRRSRPTSRTDGRSPRGGAASRPAVGSGGVAGPSWGGGVWCMGHGARPLAKPGEDFAP